jgi:hypothetical protein
MLRNMKKSTQDLIETYVLLVYYGFKDSYLVDCCMLSQTEAIHMVRLVYDQYSLSPDTEVLVVMLKDDVFILNASAHSAKQYRMLDITNDVSSTMEHLPVLVDIHRDMCSLAANETAQALYQQLHLLFESCLTIDCAGKAFEVPAMDAVSAPLLAGWLLGYPCLYQSHGSNSEHTADSSLSMMELTLFCIKGTVTVYRPVNSSSKPASKKSKQTALTLQRAQHHADLELLSFSVPQCILQDGEVHRRVAGMTNQTVERMKALAASLAEQSSGKRPARVEVTDILLEVTTCTVPSIVL